LSLPSPAARTPTRRARRTTTTSRTGTEVPFAFGLGANLGDARATLARAIERLGERFGALTVAPLYRTEPVSRIPQGDFLNTVAVGRTDESAEVLHAFARRLERELGRRERPRDAPREIDLDLLFVGAEQRDSPELVLPHPRLRERRFVLTPLAEVLPDYPLPPDGATPRQLLARLPAGARVERLDGSSEPG
jgi:2-amino-4-hydroxy-6-hydroxymethyldihydropteridine diphosphokinase